MTGPPGAAAPGPSAAPPATGPAHRAVPPRRALLAGAAGNFVEWYEFGVYGCFATVIAERFFTPAGAGADPAVPLLAAYASFAVAFFFRPAGALLFGRLADRAGRRPALVLVIALMTLATTLIGLLPDRATAGAAAPWLLVLLRAVQGLCAGGEFGGAVALMTEHAPPGRRGRYGAWQSFTVALGLLAGAAAAALTASLLSPAALSGWGWRIPFLLALPLGLTALALRTALPGPPIRTFSPEPAPAPEPASGIGTVRAVVLGVGRIMGWSAAGYTFLVVLPSYLQSTLGASFREALIATTLANLGFAASILPAGRLSDRVGRRPVMLAGALAVALCALPLLHLLRDPDAAAPAKAAALLAAGATVGLLAGPGPAMLAEMFPSSVRCTGLGLAYALANAVFSGCAGLIVTALTAATGDPDVPAYYAGGLCALSALALAGLRGDDHRGALR
ncbi:MHS family proline/betaine transporter-like MFS transporter [Streptomyces sp. SPB4]|uniref:MFS transporter n=1 Tax=Streptomyces lavendulae TaxID=1914 RepID=UPI00247D56AE|nr:MHS family proline/betaine transporter-like MFS transporter [Streptomyces sp. SPB4]